MALSGATFDKIALNRMENCRMTQQNNADQNVTKENDTHKNAHNRVTLCRMIDL